MHSPVKSFIRYVVRQLHQIELLVITKKGELFILLKCHCDVCIRDFGNDARGNKLLMSVQV